MMQSWKRRSTLALPSYLIFSSVLMAQGTGVIYGTVTDPTAAGVAGAKVEAVSVDRGTTRIGRTGATGDYVLSAMPIGKWEVRVSADGFQQFRRTSVVLDANQDVRIDAQLKLGSMTESVIVTAEAPL